MKLIGAVWLTLAAVAVAGCGSRSQVATPRAADSPVAASSGSSSSQIVRTPTPTYPPSPLVGPPTTPIPAGTTTVTITFLYASDSFATAPADVLYRKTVTDAELIQRIVSQVDALTRDSGALTRDSGATRGCTGSSVDLRLDFAGPGPLATLNENSPCARATLIIGGKPGPLLDSAVGGWIEQTLGVKEVLLPNGQSSVQPVT